MTGDKAGVRPSMAVRARAVGLRALIGGLLALPYRWRVPLTGWVMAHVIGPIAGYDRRIRENLALVMPDLPAAEVRRLERAVPDNAGRTLIEIYSGQEFVVRATTRPPEGEGVEALDAAHAAGRPAILVTGHFGNYDAARAVLFARGFRVGSLYKPMTDAAFNAHYVAAMEAIGKPMFPRGREGLSGMLRFLRGGGMLAMAIDQTMSHGAPLTFFDMEAPTALSAAELALRHDAILVPVYGIRQPDGLSFRVVVEAPVPHGTPEAMTQALNDSLERQVRRHPDQWLWIHRRWKGGADTA